MRLELESLKKLGTIINFQWQNQIILHVNSFKSGFSDHFSSILIVFITINIEVIIAFFESELQRRDEISPEKS